MNIPAVLIQPYVAKFVGDSPQMHGPLPRLAALAEKTALHYDTIQRVFTREDYVVEFEVADRILCAVGAVEAWYKEPLNEIYRETKLLEIHPPKGRCARRGCTKPLPPKTWGGLPRKYCSESCRKRAASQRRNSGRYSNWMDQCVNGHDWNEANTYIRPNGKRHCRACVREHYHKVRSQNGQQEES